jgi:hypothetical protein
MTKAARISVTVEDDSLERYYIGHKPSALDVIWCLLTDLQSTIITSTMHATRLHEHYWPAEIGSDAAMKSSALFARHSHVRTRSHAQ